MLRTRVKTPAGEIELDPAPTMYEALQHLEQYLHNWRRDGLTFAGDPVEIRIERSET